MNSEEYSEKLKRRTFRSRIEELVLSYLLGAVCVGAWLLAMLDPLPRSIYGDLSPENRSLVQLLFWGFGVLGICLLIIALRATIALWRGKFPPENYDDDLV